MEYNPEKFKDVADTQLGKDLWKFLNASDNVIRMETAVELGKTPAEALARVLVERFGDDVRLTGLSKKAFDEISIIEG